MAIFAHKFSGVLPAGDTWSVGWHSSSGLLSIDGSHGNAVTWAADVWNGVGGSPGIGAEYTGGTIMTRVTTAQLDVAPPYRTDFSRETDVTHAGTALGNASPQQVAIVVSLRTANAGRKGRGRLYLPGPAAAALTSLGQLATADQGHFLASLLAAWGVSNAAGERPVIFSKTLGTATAITTFGMGERLDTQSRRIDKVTQVRTFDTMP